MREHSEIPPVVTPRRLRVVTKIVVTSEYIDRMNKVVSVFIALFTMIAIGFVGWFVLDLTNVLASELGRRLYFVGWAVIGLGCTFLIQSRIARWLDAAIVNEDPAINYTDIEDLEDPDP